MSERVRKVTARLVRARVLSALIGAAALPGVAAGNWSAPVQGCSGLGIVLQADAARVVASGAERVSVVAVAGAGPVVARETGTVAGRRQFEIKASAREHSGPESSAASELLLQVPTTCASAEAWLEVDALSLSQLVITVSGVSVRSEGAAVLVQPDPAALGGGFYLSSRTGTIKVYKPDALSLEIETSGEITSEFSLEIEHLDGREPSKRAIVAGEDPSAPWAIQCLRCSVEVRAADALRGQAP